MRRCPEYLLNILKKNKAKDLRSMICGTLPPHAVKIAQFRKGDVFNLGFERDDEKVEKLKAKGGSFDMLDHPLILQTWGRVSAITSSRKLKFTCVTHKERKEKTIADIALLVQMLGFPADAAEEAQRRNMTLPA